TWSAPAGQALLMSLVLRGEHPLLPLAAAVAVAEACGDDARIKWPNDVLVDGRKVAGILSEGRPQAGWAVLGIGLNVAVRLEDLPPELHATAGTLGLRPGDVEPVLAGLLVELDTALGLSREALLGAYRRRDALRGRRVSWSGGSGSAAGIDAEGRLIVDLDDGGRAGLNAGEVNLTPHPR
ncbi:MAG: biotin--[acetyl-CoA-carboxylase] ligase, partial [Actinomycetota bacterium]|nr:biotin--[acetyl-CoA-carboxylase] ligase [Actinomycetota bacterium]